MNRRSSFGAIAALLFCGPVVKQVAASQCEQVSVIDVQKRMITALPKGYEAIQTPPIRPVVFEGAREDADGLTLRFGNGVDHSLITFTGMKKLSLKDAKRLIELTGQNVKSVEMVKALEQLGL